MLRWWMANVQVKRVPDELHEALRRRARARGVSLNDLLLEMLKREMSRPTISEWVDAARKLGVRADYDVQELMDDVRGDPWPT